MTTMTTTTTIDPTRLRQGMQVFSGEDRLLGPIERLDATALTVKGEQYEFSSVARLDGDRVYLTRQVGATAGRADRAVADATAAGAHDEGEVRVPVYEERLGVEKRAAERGEVQLHTTVTEEQQVVPVELQREEVRVQQVDTVERPASATEIRNAFEGSTIRVPVHGEEAVVTKTAVVTGEVVVTKERTTEHQQVADTVRKERVDVDEDYEQPQTGAVQRAAGPREDRAPQSAAGTATAAKGSGRKQPEDDAGWQELHQDARDAAPRTRAR
jgi:uncharacterized protein (TIGR02271 family)